MNKKYLYLAMSGVVGVIFSILYLVFIQPKPLTKQQYADIYLVCFLQRALNSGDKVKKAESICKCFSNNMDKMRIPLDKATTDDINESLEDCE